MGQIKQRGESIFKNLVRLSGISLLLSAECGLLSGLTVGKVQRRGVSGDRVWGSWFWGLGLAEEDWADKSCSGGRCGGQDGSAE